MAEHTIPTIDLTPLRSGNDADKRKVARQIDAACRDTGFFLVTGHGVPADLIAKTRQRAVNITSHTETVCRVIGGHSAEQLAAITDAALEDLHEDGALPAYEVWRRRIQNNIALGVTRK